MRRGPRVNLSLSPLPGEQEILQAVEQINAEKRFTYGASSTEIARKLGVEGAKRLGRGAVKGSWSGTMSPSLRISPRLSVLTKRGLLSRFSGERADGTREYRYRYVVTSDGRKQL